MFKAERLISSQEIPAQGLIDWANNLTPSLRWQLDAFIEQIITYNKRYNITGIAGKPDLVNKFVIESLVPLYLGLLPTAAKVIDLGSGAGIPGIVLAILRPDIKLTSIDKSVVKIKFQKQIKTFLALKQFSPQALRVEDLLPQKSYNRVVSRAYSSCATVLAQSLSLLQPGGEVWLWKGRNWQQDWQAAPPAINESYQLKSVWRYEINPKVGGCLLIFSLISR